MLSLQQRASHSEAVNKARTQHKNTEHFDGKFDLVEPASCNVILIQCYKNTPSCEVFSNVCDNISVKISLTHPVHS